jgi:hypothetical protein
MCKLWQPRWTHGSRWAWKESVSNNVLHLQTSLTPPPSMSQTRVWKFLSFAQHSDRL